jgi:hypothetical protein
VVVIVALDILAALVVAVLAALIVFAIRRRVLQRHVGTFDCSLRLDRSNPGTGWVFGIARYTGDAVEWYRVFSYSPRPREVLRRGELEVIERRVPEDYEEMELLSGAIVLECSQLDRRVEMAMSEDALTGFLSWLEAAPPGQHVNVA